MPIPPKNKSLRCKKSAGISYLRWLKSGVITEVIFIYYMWGVCARKWISHYIRLHQGTRTPQTVPDWNCGCDVYGYWYFEENRSQRNRGEWDKPTTILRWWLRALIRTGGSIPSRRHKIGNLPVIPHSSSISHFFSGRWLLRLKPVWKSRFWPLAFLKTTRNRLFTLFCW